MIRIFRSTAFSLFRADSINDQKTSRKKPGYERINNFLLANCF